MLRELHLNERERKKEERRVEEREKRREKEAGKRRRKGKERARSPAGPNVMPEYTAAVLENRCILPYSKPMLGHSGVYQLGRSQGKGQLQQ